MFCFLIYLDNLYNYSYQFKHNLYLTSFVCIITCDTYKSITICRLIKWSPIIILITRIIYNWSKKEKSILSKFYEYIRYIIIIFFLEEAINIIITIEIINIIPIINPNIIFLFKLFFFCSFIKSSK